jgi:hypothetical protein
MSQNNDQLGSTPMPPPPPATTAQQRRINYLFRHVAQDPGAQYLKTLIESIQTGAAT